MSDYDFSLIKDFLQYASTQIQLLDALSDQDKNLKIKSISYLHQSSTFGYRPEYTNLKSLNSIIQTMAQTNLPHIPYINPPDQYIFRLLQQNITQSFKYKHPSFDDQIEQLKVEYTKFVAECIKDPFRMVNANNAKECTHYLFFNCLHIKLNTDSLLPCFKLELGGEIQDITEHQQEFFCNIPVFLNSRKPTQSGMETMKHFLLYIFLRKSLGNDFQSNASVFLSHTTYYLDSEELRGLDKYQFFHSSRMLSVLRSIAMKSSKINFYKLYRGCGFVSWSDHVKRHEYMQAHKAELDQWLEYDERMYYYLIRNLHENLSFDIFSPDNLIETHGLKDRRSAKTLLSLNNSLFFQVTDEMRHGTSRQLHSMILHWLSYTTKHPNPNSYAVIAILRRLSVNNPLSPSLLESNGAQIIILFDLIFERVMQIWSGLKKPNKEFYKAVNLDLLIEQIFEYLYFCDPNNNTAGDDERDYGQVFLDGDRYILLKDISVLGKKTTLASLERRIVEWHKATMLKKMQFVEYPFVFQKTVFGDYVFEQLANTLDVIKERAEMHHCIASYHEMMILGKYVAFRVYSENERATLGVEIITQDGQLDYRYNQCYGHCNQIVSAKLMATVKKFITELKKPHFI